MLYASYLRINHTRVCDAPDIWGRVLDWDEQSEIACKDIFAAGKTVTLPVFFLLLPWMSKEGFPLDFFSLLVMEPDFSPIFLLTPKKRGWKGRQKKRKKKGELRIKEKSTWEREHFGVYRQRKIMNNVVCGAAWHQIEKWEAFITHTGHFIHWTQTRVGNWITVYWPLRHSYV